MCHPALNTHKYAAHLRPVTSPAPVWTRINITYIPGQNLVPEPADEAEEADEGGFDPPGPDPDGGEHLAPLPEQHGLQRERGPAEGRLARASVTVILGLCRPQPPPRPRPPHRDPS